MIEKVLLGFTHIIQEHRIITDRQDNQISDYKARLVFKNDSYLEFSEIHVIRLSKRKYSFRWMTSDFELIIRWDNAPHHPQISTFPHHRHVGHELTIEPSEEVNLADVLRYVESELAKD